MHFTAEFRTTLSQHEYSARAIPAGIRRALAIRDGFCQFPGCDCQHHLDVHHILHWAYGGDTSLENLIEVCTLCRIRHNAITIISCCMKGNSQWFVRRPDGTPFRSAVERNGAKTCSQIKLMYEQPWSAFGDEMDYAMALYNLACTNRE